MMESKDRPSGRFGPLMKEGVHHETMESGDSDLEVEGAQAYAALFSAVFGESSSDTDADSNDHCTEVEDDTESYGGYFWEKVEDVEGLWHCRNFLSPKQQRSLSQAIDSEGWFCDALHNQAMRFGNLPEWAKGLSTLIQSRSGGQRSDEKLDLQRSDHYSKIDGSDECIACSSPFPSRILEREPLFDQMIVNLYQPGEGIAAHVDLLRFEDGIAIVSLESACVMSFRVVNDSNDGVEGTSTVEPILDRSHESRPCYANHVFGSDTEDLPHCRLLVCEQLEAPGSSPQAEGYTSQSHTCERDPSSGVAKKVEVLLNPGDLIIASGPARYKWTHEINRGNGNQLWHGQPIVQQRRVSVTLRRLCSPKDV